MFRLNLTWLSAVVFTLLICGAATAGDSVALEAFAGKLKQVRVTIAGSERRFLFDTGGGYTLISPAVAQALGCKPAGRIAGFRMRGDRFDTQVCQDVRFTIGSLPSQIETVGVFDLMALLPKELPRLEGVVSLASFRGRRIALDLAGGRLDAAAKSKGHDFRCRIATGLDGSNYVLFAAVERDGMEFWFEVDSGNVDVLLVARHSAASFGLDPSSQESKQIDFSLGKARTVRVAARAADILYDGVIGAEFLERGILFANLSGNTSCSWLLRP